MCIMDLEKCYLAMVVLILVSSQFQVMTKNVAYAKSEQPHSDIRFRQNNFYPRFDIVSNSFCCAWMILESGSGLEFNAR